MKNYISLVENTAKVLDASKRLGVPVAQTRALRIRDAADSGMLSQ
jgi:hypothetical protein